jgi:hypothetical protein
MSFIDTPVDADPAIASRFVIANGVTDFTATSPKETAPVSVAQINALRPKVWIPSGSCEGGLDEPHCVYADNEATRRTYFGEAQLRED